MDYAVEIGFGAMTDIRSFIKNGSDIQKLIGALQTHIHTQTYTHILEDQVTSLLLFFKTKEGAQKYVCQVSHSKWSERKRCFIVILSQLRLRTGH
jgi:hypothetical protein